MITNHRSDFKVAYEILSTCTNEKLLAVSVSKSVDLSLRKTMIMLNGLLSIGFLVKFRNCDITIKRKSLKNRSYLWETSNRGTEFLRTIEQIKDVNFRIH